MTLSLRLVADLMDMSALLNPEPRNNIYVHQVIALYQDACPQILSEDVCVRFVQLDSIKGMLKLEVKQYLVVGHVKQL